MLLSAVNELNVEIYNDIPSELIAPSNAAYAVKLLTRLFNTVVLSVEVAV